jgi:predicted transcriptional regulator
MDEMTDTITELTAAVVVSFVANHQISKPDLISLIDQVYTTFSRIVTGTEESPVAAKPVPAVSPRKSITPDHLVCLEDGKSFKSLKRHLRVDHDMSPEEYREKWGLPPDYPMVSPNYAATRSEVARKMGLGQRSRPPEPVAPQRRGRPAKPAAT